MPVSMHDSNCLGCVMHAERHNAEKEMWIKQFRKNKELKSQLEKAESAIKEIGETIHNQEITMWNKLIGVGNILYAYEKGE